MPDPKTDQALATRNELPQTREVARYEKILPGAANRILKMVERDQRTDLRLLWANWLAEFVSMVLGKAFVYVLVLAAVYLAVHDKPLEAFLAGVAPIAIAVYANVRKKSDSTDQ